MYGYIALGKVYPIDMVTRATRLCHIIGYTFTCAIYPFIIALLVKYLAPSVGVSIVESTDLSLSRQAERILGLVPILATRGAPLRL